MIDFRTLGSLDLRGPDGQELLSILTQPKRVAVLAYIAAAGRGEPLRRDTLLGVFWPELDQDRARAALRKALHYLRRTLGENALVTRGEDEVALGRDTVRCDVLDVLDALDDDRAGDALELYRGAFLEGFHVSETGFERWLDAFRSELHARVVSAATAMAEHAAQEGNQAGALSWAERALAVDPLEEPALRHLVRAKLALGDRTGAIRAFERFRERLAAEYEIDPSPETVALLDELEAASPTPSVPASPDRQDGAPAMAGSLDRDFHRLRPLGEGAVATVYLARERSLHRLVAIKEMRPRFAQDAEVRRRFLREARSAAQIVHPNVTSIFRVGPDGEQPYIIMEYVEGRTLADAMVAEGPFPPAEVRRMLGEVAAALAAAHEQRIVHRDIRPSNILREDATGRIVLTDFGLAKALETGGVTRTILTSPGAVLGDPDHISPEQLRGEPVTEATDIYSVGVLGYELLAGAGPYTASSPAARARAHLSEEPRLLRDVEGADPALGALLRRCLAKKPEQRPRASDLVEALSRPAAEPAEIDATPSKGALQSFLSELRRRKVYRVAAAYGAFVYVALELGNNLPILAGVLTVITAVLLAGFPVAVALAWMFDLTERGVVRATAAGEDLTPERRAQMMVLQVVGLVASLLVGAAIVWWITS